ncbi:Acetyl-CoA acetyltransferase [uncultured delta proteobacterium]|uniref:Acetyl-CoA acetyltransferase n=1 Tax=uncultured delta proteobacterium TaxID=34034 RepID=A0A212KAF7_9DELT|nr:Acetyl-CoA acetyltransferase [uncultured delta proteobacterium]
MSRSAVLVSGARTPIGKCRGSLAEVPASTLASIVMREAVKRAGIEPSELDDVVFGNLLNSEACNMARLAALEAGFPFSVPAVTMDRQCASGLETMAYAAAMIQAGFKDVLLAGGVESDSTRTYIMEKPKAAYQVMPPQWATYRTAPGDLNVPMGITAENVAEACGVTREECDAFAVESHKKAAHAWEQGYFNEQIVPVTIRGKKGDVIVAADECVRKDASLESMAALKPAFKKDGIVTAGNSSPMNDGAGAVVIMEEGRARSGGYAAMFRFKAYAVAGVDPRMMGLGPVEAVRKLFRQTGMTFADIDLVELNEAFAAQSLGCIRELNIPPDKLNVNGGAIALGHPLAGTGGILVTKLMYELVRRGCGVGMVSFCIGGGQGAAAVIERM